VQEILAAKGITEQCGISLDDVSQFFVADITIVIFERQEMDYAQQLI
jgi:hypothetical protein